MVELELNEEQKCFEGLETRAVFDVDLKVDLDREIELNLLAFFLYVQV